MLWQILVQFLLRLSFGLAAAMAVTSPRQVSSGFFRVHLWVLLGLNTLVCLASFGRSADLPGALWVAAIGAGTAVLCWVGAVCWLYELSRAGRLVLCLITIAGMGGAALATRWPWQATPGRLGAPLLDLLTGGLLLGTTICAMFLGHWYLTSPGMDLRPLRRLLAGMLAAVVARGLVCGWGLSGPWDAPGSASGLVWALFSLRWLAGVVGALILGGLAWQTLRIPNTQSATGILYVGVVFVFLGELSAQLLSAA